MFSFHQCQTENDGDRPEDKSKREVQEISRLILSTVSITKYNPDNLLLLEGEATEQCDLKLCWAAERTTKDISVKIKKKNRKMTIGVFRLENQSSSFVISKRILCILSLDIFKKMIKQHLPFQRTHKRLSSQGLVYSSP